MKTIYKIASILAVCLLAFAVIPWQASAEEVKTRKTEEVKVTNQKEFNDLLSKYNKIAAKYGYSFDGSPMFNDIIKQADLPTLSEFEASLQPSTNEGEDIAVSPELPQISLMSISNGTKTYDRIDKMPVFSFVSRTHLYAKVTRKNKIVKKVKRWAEIGGLTWPVKVTVYSTWYKLNKDKRHGKVYFRFKKYKYLIPGYPEIGYVSYTTSTPLKI
ncbi:hypothetical protein EZL62_01485 [Listeria monocytogenes]|nr:hypothetical protein [Listeria monocytogenes]